MTDVAAADRPNLLMVQLFEFRGEQEPFGSTTVCARCAAEDPSEAVDCVPVGPPSCICGPAIDTNDALRQAFALARVSAVPADLPLCMRVVAYDAEVDGALRDCSGEPVCAVPDDLADRAEICGLSQVFALSSESPPVVLIDEVICRSKDERIEHCRGHACTCEDADHRICILASDAIDADEYPVLSEGFSELWERECTAGCGQEVADGCYRASRACFFQRNRIRSTRECASF